MFTDNDYMFLGVLTLVELYVNYMYNFQ